MSSSGLYGHWTHMAYTPREICKIKLHLKKRGQVSCDRFMLYHINYSLFYMINLPVSLSMQKRDPLILVILFCICGGVPFFHAGSREQSGTKVRRQACGKHLHLLSHPQPQLSLFIHHKALNYFNIFLLGKISWPLSRLLYILSPVLTLLLVNKRHLLWASQDSVGFLPPYSKPHDNFPTV